MKAKLTPQNIEVEVKEGQSLFDALRDQDVFVRNSCGGHSSCGECIVKFVDGLENLNELTFGEKQLLGNVFFITKERLSCQVQIKGDVTVDMSAHDPSGLSSKAKMPTQ